MKGFGFNFGLGPRGAGFPPPPAGFAYVVDDQGRFVVDDQGRYIISEKA